MIKDLFFEVDDQKLIGTLYKAEKEKAAALIIAGGGNIPRNEGCYPSWQKYFADQGITTFNFDFRGVGESDEKLKNTNLETRVKDAKAALKVLKDNSNTDNIYILGRSMGGPVAIQIVDSNIKGILLAVPAAYSLEARDKKFGPDFSEEIRRHESWKNSPDFKQLGEYMGKLFLLYGTKDQVVPANISLEYKKVANSKNGTVLILKGEDHTSWVANQKNLVLSSLTRFILE